MMVRKRFNTAVVLFFSLQPFFAQGALISSKCLKPLKAALAAFAETTDQLPVSASVPVECQYYEFRELDKDLQSKILTQLGKSDKTANQDTKLSEVMGFLTTTGRALADEPKNDCFSVLKRNMAKVSKFKQSGYYENASKSECEQKVHKFDQSLENSPSDCNLPAKKLTGDFKKYYEDEVVTVFKDANIAVKSDAPVTESLTKLRTVVSTLLMAKCGFYPN